jgi:hypothetical protein
MPYDDDYEHTDLSGEQPSDRADPRIELIESRISLFGLEYVIKMRASTSTGRPVVLATAIAIVTVIAIGLIGVVLGYGAPDWVALAAGGVPVALFSTFYALDRRRSIRMADTKQILGRRRRDNPGSSSVADDNADSGRTAAGDDCTGEHDADPTH